MTTDLATTNSSPLRTLKEQIAPDATDAELAYFGEVCQRLGLSPFKGEIYLIGRWNSQAKRKIHRPQISVDGRRVLAARTHMLAGIEGPQWCGRREDNGGELVWHDVWDNDDQFPYAARVLVHVKGWPKPANGTVKWSEFAQTDKDGNLLDMWKRMPSHMLGKTAESLALRRAFADVIPADFDISEDTLDIPSTETPTVSRPENREPAQPSPPEAARSLQADTTLPRPPPSSHPGAQVGTSPRPANTGGRGTPPGPVAWGDGTPMFDQSGKQL